MACNTTLLTNISNVGVSETLWSFSRRARLLSKTHYKISSQPAINWDMQALSKMSKISEDLLICWKDYLNPPISSNNCCNYIISTLSLFITSPLQWEWVGSWDQVFIHTCVHFKRLVCRCPVSRSISWKRNQRKEWFSIGFSSSLIMSGWK